MNDNQGFTLLEALIVMIILSLAGMAMGVAVLQVKDRAVLAGAEAQITRTLAHAQSAARRSGSIRHVVFDLDQRRFQIEETQEWQFFPKEIELSITSARELGSSRRPSVIYLGDGTNSGADITLMSGGYTRHFRVEWLTGRIGDAF